MARLRSCYHGTNAEAAEAILKEGFRAGTYFATHLEDALGYGGANVFEVALPKDVVPNHWQFIPQTAVPASQIVRLTMYTTETVMERPELAEAVRLSNIGPDGNAIDD